MVEPQSPQGEHEPGARVCVAALELRQAGDQQVRVCQGRERALEAGPAEESHGRRIQPLGVVGRDQREQAGGLVQIDMPEIGCRSASGCQVTSRDRATQPRQWGSLRGHERMFA